MKKILIFIVFVGLLVGIYYFYKKDNNNNNNPVEPIDTEFKGVFVSYIDYSSLLLNKSVDEKKENISKMISNIDEFNFNTIILQVRPFADAIYKSDIFKPSKTIVKNEDTELDLDILDYFLAECHKKNIKIYAWINPYRIRTSDNINDISSSSIFYPWLDKDNNNIEITSQGIYLNPASEEVLELILEGVKEIVNKYDVDGILYDDYFYPSKTIDEDNYNQYKTNGGDMTIEEYRINKIDTLIKKSYETIKEIKKDVLFGISPSGNVENNLNQEYLDITSILRQDNYLDFVMPQLYYGFFNDAKPYLETLNTWNNLIENNNTKLIVGLSIYKSGTKDSFAGEGENEWIENSDIIKKQIVVSRNEDKYNGFSIFRYEHLFSSSKANEELIKEKQNLLDLLE